MTITIIIESFDEYEEEEFDESPNFKSSYSPSAFRDSLESYDDDGNIIIRHSSLVLLLILLHI